MCVMVNAAAAAPSDQSHSLTQVVCGSNRRICMEYQWGHNYIATHDWLRQMQVVFAPARLRAPRSVHAPDLIIEQFDISGAHSAAKQCCCSHWTSGPQKTEHISCTVCSQSNSLTTNKKLGATSSAPGDFRWILNKEHCARLSGKGGPWSYRGGPQSASVGENKQQEQLTLINSPTVVYFVRGGNQETGCHAWKQV